MKYQNLYSFLSKNDVNKKKYDDTSESFSSTENECKNVRNGCGIIDFSNRGRILIKGNDKEEFLQGIITNDTKKLQIGKGIPALMLNPKGKILSIMSIYAIEDYYLIDIDISIKDQTIANLKKYIFRDKVEVLDYTDETGLISIQGSNSEQLIKDMLSYDTINMNELSSMKIKKIGSNLHLIKKSRFNEIGYEIYGQKNDIINIYSYLSQKINDESNIGLLGSHAINVLMLESRIPVYNKDIWDEILPQEARLENYVDFKKGCYVGQEVVIRLHNMGHVNKLLTGIQLDGNILEKDDLIMKENEVIGKITRSAFSYRLKKTIAMGYIRIKYVNDNEKIKIKHKDVTINAEVIKLPT